MIPTVGTTLAIARNTDEMIEAFCVVKNSLQLSNAFIEAMGLLADGHLNKVIGPTRSKNLSPLIMNLLFETLAVEVHFHVNHEAVKRMQHRWEGREQRNVRLDSKPPSQKLIERAKPYVAKAMGSKGAEVSNSMRTAEHRTKIATKAANIRWKRRGLKQTKRARSKRVWWRGRKERERAKIVPEVSP